MKRPRAIVVVGTYAALTVATAVVLYPVLLVLKKAFEPGRQFAISASPIPTRLTLDHFGDLFSARGGHGELMFLHHAWNSLVAAVALGSIWTFNMFNVIFLVSGGKPGESTNILVTDAYRWAFERGDRYGMAAAEATLIFLILLLWTVFGTRIVRSKDAT